MRRELLADITPSSRRMKLENKEKEDVIRRLSVASFNRNASSGDIIGTVTQEDSVVLKLKIVDDSGQSVNPSGETIKLYINRADETIYEQDNNITIFEDGVIQIICRDTAFNVVGNQTCHLELTNSEGTSITSPFIIEVEKSPIGKEVLNNTNEVKALEELRNTTDKFNKELDMLLGASGEEKVRIENEEVRKTNEKNRQNTVVKLQEDYDSLKRVIIDENQAAQLQDNINEVSSQLSEKANEIDVYNKGTVDSYLDKKRESTDIKPINVSEMDTETKKLFTGGAVAVVDVDTILNENIVSKQVTVDKTNFVDVGKNKININNRGKLGEWCNYTNGNIESTEYTTTFYRTYYEPIIGGETYTRKYGSDGTSFFNKNKKFISGTQENTFTTPENARYVIYNFQNYHLDEQVELGDKPTSYEPYVIVFNGFKSNAPILDEATLINPNITGVPALESKYITAGIGGEFEKIIEGFEYAYQNDKELVIMPGIYDIVAEGVDLSSSGMNTPKKIYGYGATIIANLSTENWVFFPLIIPYKSNYNVEIYGLTIICDNCRYCIHDDLGSFNNYYHKFKDLTLIINSNISETLIMPRAIGGGTGSNGFIEIDSCVLSSNTPADIDYHSDWQGTQTKETIIKCKNSIFKTTITGTSIGSDTSFKNKLYVNNCLCGTELPKLNSDENFEIKQWNNVLDKQ